MVSSAKGREVTSQEGYLPYLLLRILQLLLNNTNFPEKDVKAISM
jgi:hypothetical protein